MAKTTAGPARTMTAQHKAALAQGRSEGRAVKSYLEALEKNRPRRGRKRTPESIKKRLSAIDTQLRDASALHRLQLVQEKMDLEKELAQLGAEDRPLGAGGRVREDRRQVRGAQGDLLRRVAPARRVGRHPQESRHHALSEVRESAAAASSERSSTTPSPEPMIASLARSGCGMSPTTLPASFAIPAMSSRLPLGLST